MPTHTKPLAIFKNGIGFCAERLLHLKTHHDMRASISFVQQQQCATISALSCVWETTRPKVAPGIPWLAGF
jgi:hypothetical protein